MILEKPSESIGVGVKNNTLSSSLSGGKWYILKWKRDRFLFVSEGEGEVQKV